MHVRVWLLFVRIGWNFGCNVNDVLWFYAKLNEYWFYSFLNSMFVAPNQTIIQLQMILFVLCAKLAKIFEIEKIIIIQPSYCEL